MAREYAKKSRKTLMRDLNILEELGLVEVEQHMQTRRDNRWAYETR